MKSATAGLHLALEALGIGPGDEGRHHTHTFTATAEVARYLGADVRLVDIDPQTLCIDPNAVEAASGEDAGDRARALRRPRRRHGGDPRHRPASRPRRCRGPAHALPATCGGRLVGTLDSDATVFSFYATSHHTGEGGMVVGRDDKLLRRIKTMRLHGMSRDALRRFTATVPSWY